MSWEVLVYILAAVPPIAKFLKTQSLMQETAAHAIGQNTEIMARQTSILESVMVLLNNLTERVDGLEAEEEGEQTDGIGFRVEDEEDDEEEEEDGDQVNRGSRSVGFRR